MLELDTDPAVPVGHSGKVNNADSVAVCSRRRNKVEGNEGKQRLVNYLDRGLRKEVTAPKGQLTKFSRVGLPLTQ